MDIKNVFPNKDQFDTMNTLLASIARNSGSEIEPKSFTQIRDLTRLGLAKKLFSVGDQFVAEKGTNVVASKGNSTGITAISVNKITFIQAMGIAQEQIYEFTYDGAIWHKENGENIILADYGITITGTPVDGDQIIITETTEKLTFDVVDFNKHTKNSQPTNTIDLLLHDIYTYGTIPFSTSQLLYYSENGLAAGNYKFTADHSGYYNNTGCDGTYMFTLTQPIPAKGGFRHTKMGASGNYTKESVTGNYIETYNPTLSGGTKIETVFVGEYDGTTECIDLGTFTAQRRDYYTEDDAINVGGKRNFTERNAYGSNRWKHSVYRQWLNSSASEVPNGSSVISNWWTPQTVWDRIPGGAKLAGFMYGLDPDFIASINAVQVKTALHTCDRVGSETFEITNDKIFLASRQNIFNSNEYSGIDEGGAWELFRNATNEDRIKYQNGTARYWWLRTPYSGISHDVRSVITSGALSHNFAGSAYGVVPACCII